MTNLAISRTKLIVIGSIVICALIAMYFIPIKTTEIGYCRLNDNVDRHYSYIFGESVFFNSPLLDFTVDDSGLLCNGGSINIRLYIL